jgi:hypothetical protein
MKKIIDEFTKDYIFKNLKKILIPNVILIKKL